MYKTESVLGLIGAIIGAVTVAIILIICLVLCLTVSVNTVWEFVDSVAQTDVYDVVTSFTGVLSGVLFALVLGGLVITVASVVLGFIGTAKLNKDDKSGGVLLIIAGALAFISFVGLISMVLFLVGGIMAMTKKEPAAA